MLVATAVAPSHGKTCDMLKWAGEPDSYTRGSWLLDGACEATVLNGAAAGKSAPDVLRDLGFGALLQEPAAVWHHAPRAPTGALGLAWRQGWLGWVPEAGPGWALPGLGSTAAQDGDEGGAAPGAGGGEPEPGE